MQPLAARLRPKTLTDFVGQSHLLGEGKVISRLIKQNILHAMILWGPPGVGKTTLAGLFSKLIQAEFIILSAVTAGVKEIRQIAQQAQQKQQQGQQTILFVDEIHRFNKAQQDALLPDVERGTFILIGATTENPSFALNNALLSRVRVYVLKPLTTEDLATLMTRALTDCTEGLGQRHFIFPEDLQQALIVAADGDARRLLNLLEMLSDLVEDDQTVTKEMLSSLIGSAILHFDQNGEYFYDLISALHKSVRGSDPNAALYWFCRMIAAGCDPRYLARRMIRMASEDIGNADPRALQLTLDAAEAYERLGSPEGELALAQALIYLSVAAKSNAVYVAYHEAMQDLSQYGNAEIPLSLRNAPTQLMKNLDYGKTYRYAHDEPHAYAAGARYFPDNMPEKNYYKPTDRGLEKQIQKKLDFLKALSKK